jgi:CDK inhibitor PHO81
VIQVTKDFHPVIYSDWSLPETRFAICVADVTLAQFEALAATQGRRMDSAIDMNAPDWHAKASKSMVSLAQLMQVRRHQRSITARCNCVF